MSAPLRSITGQLPDERGYKAVTIERIPGDHESPAFWAIIGYNEVWNNAPHALWQYHARDEAEAEEVAEWLRGIGSATERRKAGRPTTDPAARRKHSSFTLSPAVLDILDQLVARTGKSKSALVEEALRRLAAQEPGR